ncbi:LysR family transcriptional regulator [Vreelandella hamiltonii]|uniref:LysR family transcriptional regulator n=1 Tax=Halomonas johnsoniae TaxID=502832 RepID=A0ABQ2WSL5_9GAMM|nr:LysR family transcriptional regulator [Halomonas johnsoniae]GGW65530.1 LysR family transcriptional regulator [Halomonas johnsoniae]
MNNLRRIDLNLLVTLHALLVEKHVSRAARRLHKSQPAVSHALAHLRAIFDDPLLVRRTGKLELTSRASELLPALTEALHQLGALLDQPAFDPAQAKRVFRLTMSDYGSRVILPGLVQRLRSDAPGVELQVAQGSRASMLAGVHDGEIDMAFGVFPSPLSDELRTHTLFIEHFVCAADKNTLPSTGSLDKTAWLSRPHVLVAMHSSESNEIENALHREGVTRRVAITLPHWGAASRVVANTDLIVTTAQRSFDLFLEDSPLQLFAPPYPIDPFAYDMVWHSRRESDPGHNWLRQTIIEILRESA